MLEISMFSLYDFDNRVNTCSLLLSDKRVKRKVAQRHLVYRGTQVFGSLHKSLGKTVIIHPKWMQSPHN